MKKFWIFFVSFFVLGLIYIYAFVPSKIQVSKIEFANCNVNGASRVISDKNTWEKWWPQKPDDKKINPKSQSDGFFYDDSYFQLTGKYYNAVAISIENDNSKIDSRLNLIKVNSDSTVLMWKCEVDAGLNPLKRIVNYYHASEVYDDMTDILIALRSFLKERENVYGIDFHITMSKDSTLVAIKKTTDHYPATSEIYQLINKLKNYIHLNKAAENNFPMLHVKKTGDQFETMVAIPVNKELPGNGDIFFSRFVPWKVLTAEVKGGNATVENAFQEMKIFIRDYQKSVMAIPFASLVTDRSKEPDTSKWVTSIYTPVP